MLRTLHDVCSIHVKPRCTVALLTSRIAPSALLSVHKEKPRLCKKCCRRILDSNNSDLAFVCTSEKLVCFAYYCQSIADDKQTCHSQATSNGDDWRKPN